MHVADTISVTLPPDLLIKAREFADLEHRTMSDLLLESLRRYIATSSRDPQWTTLLQRTRAQGIALGISSEGDVERLSDEHRRDRSR